MIEIEVTPQFRAVLATAYPIDDTRTKPFGLWTRFDLLRSRLHHGHGHDMPENIDRVLSSMVRYGATIVADLYPCTQQELEDALADGGETS